MITLYINPACPFCRSTLAVANELAVPLTIKDINTPGVAAELIELGGKRQMPFMVDDVAHVSMYESDDINGYLREQFAQKD